MVIPSSQNNQSVSGRNCVKERKLKINNPADIKKRTDETIIFSINIPPSDFTYPDFPVCARMKYSIVAQPIQSAGKERLPASYAVCSDFSARRARSHRITRVAKIHVSLIAMGGVLW